MNKGFVYLIREGNSDYYKIGVTKKDNAQSRLKELQTGNANELTLIAQFESNKPFRLESMLHKKYKHLNENNEWFDFYGYNVKDEFISSCYYFQNIINALKNNPFF